MKKVWERPVVGFKFFRNRVSHHNLEANHAGWPDISANIGAIWWGHGGRVPPLQTVAT